MAHVDTGAGKKQWMVAQVTMNDPELYRAWRLSVEVKDLLDLIVTQPPHGDECSQYSYQTVCAQREQWRYRAEVAEDFVRRVNPVLQGLVRSDTSSLSVDEILSAIRRALEPDREQAEPELPPERIRFTKPTAHNQTA